jgi:hypothetical protein
MYQMLVQSLFPAYVIGCGIALSLSWSKRSFYLAFAYAYLLIVFQFIATGQAKGWGADTFLYCSYVQLVMGFCGYFGGNRTIAGLSIAAVLLNGFAALAFEIDHPIRQVYFIGVNVIQSLQILSLIAMSPAMVKLYRLFHREKRSSPWAMRAVSGTR